MRISNTTFKKHYWIPDFDVFTEID